MTFSLIGLFVLLVGVAVFFLKKSSKSVRVVPPKSPQTPRSAPSVVLAPAPVVVPAPAAVPESAEVAPPALSAFRLARGHDLSDDRKQIIMAKLRHIPLPPPSLQQLVSREFVNKATSAELSVLVMGDPLMAAKVLATVNSPFFGLQKPVGSIGQAITFLGFTSVRSIGLQYLLNNTFKAGTPDLNRVFDTIWASSALASELCLKLAQKLELPDQGALATHMVLSFIGQLATYSLMPADVAVATAKLGWLERVQGEQAQLGLCSAEIGSFLMQAWGLPTSIVDDVRDINLVLVTPVEAMDAQRGARLALCYLSAWLGEQLARGTLRDLSALDLSDEQNLDLFHLRSYLKAPALARLQEFLLAPDMRAAVAQMQQSLATRA